MVWEEIAEVEELARAGAPVQRQRPLHRAPRFGPQINLRALERGRARELRRRGPAATARRARSSRWRATCASCSRRSSSRTCARCSSACSARTPSSGPATASLRRPSTTTRPTATACSSTASGVAQAVSAISATFPGHRPRRRRHGRAAARHRQARGLHATSPQNIDLTDAGGCTARSRSATTASAARSRRSRASPPELAQALGHIILSHHGTLEHGSPVVPCTREATLVHMIDNLGGRLGQLRPPREGARSRPALVGLRPRDRRRRILRRGRGRRGPAGCRPAGRAPAREAA